ncbi:MAG: DUF1707 SHOCT-like domain-containing protein [Acidimicrobiales bacterium]
MRDDPRQMRASDADRDRVASVLREAFEEGRLRLDELDARLAAVQGSSTYADLLPCVEDLPEGDALIQRLAVGSTKPFLAQRALLGPPVPSLPQRSLRRRMVTGILGVLVGIQFIRIGIITMLMEVGHGVPGGAGQIIVVGAAAVIVLGALTLWRASARLSWAGLHSLVELVRSRRRRQ